MISKRNRRFRCNQTRAASLVVLDQQRIISSLTGTRMILMRQLRGLQENI